MRLSIANARLLRRDVRNFGLRVLLQPIHKRAGRPYTDTTGTSTGQIRLRCGSTDLDVFRQVFLGQQFSIESSPQAAVLTDAFDAILARGKRPLIIDLGANNGASALWFARKYPHATIVAVEPDASNAALCRHNVRGLDVEVLEVAIGSRAGSAALQSTPGEEWAVTTERTATGAGVPIYTVGQILDGRSDCELFIVKVDIEGFEADLFEANTDWIALACSIIIEPHDWMRPGEATSRTFQAAMGAHDFDVLISGENFVYVSRSHAVRLHATNEY